MISLPAPETAYLEQLVCRLQSGLGPRLVGVYLFGSAGYGAYEAGISDLDVQAVVDGVSSTRQREELAERLAHESLPCPAKRLDFVCYTRSAVNPARRHPHFELNFNTGDGIPEQLMFDPSAEANHWFLLDIAMGREFGHAMVGPPPATVFAPIPSVWQLQAIQDSLAWHPAHDPISPNNVLNACRGWRYAVTGALGSKAAGASWARSQPGCPPIVERAEHSRRDGAPVSPSEAADLIAIASEAVRQALLENQ